MRAPRRLLGTLAAVGFVVAAAGLAGQGGPGGDRRMVAEPVAVTAYPLPGFRRDDPALRRFGALEFIGGLELGRRHRDFGGLSGLRVAPDGGSLLAVTDSGDWIEARLLHRDGAVVGLADARIAPILVVGGRAKDAGLWDAESLALGERQAFVGIERNHALLAFDRAAGLAARGRLVPLPPFVRDWPENRGIEALAVLPASSRFPGWIVGIAERSNERDQPTEGFAMRPDGRDAFRFRLRLSDGFEATDLDVLPDGDLVLLERFFSPGRGVAMRLRRIAAAGLAPEALLDGDTLLTADWERFHIDNMEGLSAHRNAGGETILTLISDDNFSIAQRTLLLQFRLGAD